MQVDIQMKKSGAVIGSGKFLATTAVTNYSQFVVSINYTSSAAPDSFMIMFSFKSHLSLNSYYLVDDVRFDVIDNVFALERESDLIKVFPSPAEDKISFLSSSFSSNKMKFAEVFNLQGQRCLLSEFTDEGLPEMDMRNLQAGAYILSITLEDKQIVTKKIIKE